MGASVKQRFGLLILTLMIWNTSVVAHLSPAQASIQSYQYQKILHNTVAFLDTLDASQKKTLLQPMDSSYRTRGFCYVLKHCDNYRGLLLYDLDGDQKIALNRLLMYLMSSMGYHKAVAVMNRQAILNEMETTQKRYPFYLKLQGPTKADLKFGAPQHFTPPPRRSLLEYDLVIFGDIHGDTWALRFEGHHLSLNFTFVKTDKGMQISPWPIFFGVSPMLVPRVPAFAEENLHFWKQGEGEAVLWKQALLARDFVISMSQEQRKGSNWGEEAPAILFGNTDRRVTPAILAEKKAQFIALDALSPLSRYLLQEYLGEYIAAINPALLYPFDLDTIVKQAKVSWWSDSLDDPYSPFYLRVVSGDYLIELSQSQGYEVVIPGYRATHIHSALRNVKDDWDMDVINRHQHLHSH